MKSLYKCNVKNVPGVRFPKKTRSKRLQAKLIQIKQSSKRRIDLSRVVDDLAKLRNCSNGLILVSRKSNIDQ